MQFGIMVSPSPANGTLQQMWDANERILATAQRNAWSLWFCDHLQWGEGGMQPWVEGWTHMVHSSARFPKLTVGTIVLGQNYRNPGLVANMAAAFQLLSGGKLVFGIGAGWKEDEYLAYDYEFLRPGLRLDQLEEQLQIIKALWSGDHVTFEGTHYRVRDAIAIPAPDPVPPIMIGGNGDRTISVAARYADWWNSDDLPAAELKAKLARLRDKSVEFGRAADAVLPTSFISISVSEDADKVNRAANVAGTPDEVRDQLLEFHDAGSDYIQFNFIKDFPHIEEGLELVEDIARGLT